MKKLAIPLSALVLTLALMMSGCSSSPSPSAKFYLLHHETKVNQPLTSDKAIKAKVEFPDYLTQPNLVMKLGRHQLHYAQYHKWAEPLPVSFEKALNAELSAMQVNRDESLIVTVEHFHISERNSVILSGYYVAQHKHNAQLFYFENKLNEDGYPHAVGQLRKLVTLLAKQIAAS